MWLRKCTQRPFTNKVRDANLNSCYTGWERESCYKRLSFQGLSNKGYLSSRLWDKLSLSLFPSLSLPPSLSSPPPPHSPFELPSLLFLSFPPPSLFSSSFVPPQVNKWHQIETTASVSFYRCKLFHIFIMQVSSPSAFSAFGPFYVPSNLPQRASSL